MPIPAPRRRVVEQNMGNPTRKPSASAATDGFQNRRVRSPQSTEVAPIAELAGAARGETEFAFTPAAIPEADQEDEGQLLDAWHASFPSSHVTVALLKKRDGNTPILAKMVFRDDDRKQVALTTAVPWKCICSLVITGADGTRWVGTGWLAGPRTVVTAGHCVYLHGHGGWAKKIEVCPGRNGDDTSLGRFIATDFRTVTGWTDQKSPLFDYGAIILPESPGREWLTYGVYDTAKLQDLTVNVFGYPADKPPGTLWGTARRLQQVIPQKLVYNLSTFGGQSGCPVFDKQGETRTVVGIHNYGDVTGNSATRITEAVFDDLEAWKS